MARQIGGGGDNVMGSKEAVVNVAFKDDLGNILENASKLKEVLDAVNSNFIAINSAVGMTTNSMGKLASQTQRLVATTQQLRNEYQTIADASQRIGLSQSISPPSSIFQNTDVVRDALSGTGRASGLILPGSETSAIGSTGGLKDFVNPTYPQRRGGRNYANPLRNSDTREAIRWEATEKDLIEKQSQATGREKELLDEALAQHRINKPGKRNSELPDYVRKSLNPMGVGIPTQMWEDYQAGASASSIIRGLLTSSNVPAFQAIGASVPYITAGYGALAAGYKAMDYLIKGSTRYSGLTGGTGVFENTGAAEGSQTFLGMQGRAWAQGLLNMAVGPGGFQQIQEGLLGAGYTARDNAQYNKLGIRGMRYESARSALAQMYGMGLQDVDQNLQLMQLVTERGSGSLTTLMGTIENLRSTALTTNASLQVMIKTMTAAVQGLIGGMNMTGNAAVFVGGTNAAAYANAQNRLLRGSGAPDYNNFITQMMMTQSSSYANAGVNFSNMYYMMRHPEFFPQGLGLATAQATDQSVDRIIGQIFRLPSNIKNMSREQATDIISQQGAQIRAFVGSDYAKALIGNPDIYNNADATIEWLATNAVRDPQTASAEKTKRENMTRNLNLPGVSSSQSNIVQTIARSKGGATSLRDMAIDKYMSDTFGLNTIMAHGGIQNLDRSKYPITGLYEDYVTATGKGVGWIEKVLKRKDNTASNTYVKFGDTVMSLKNFLTEADTNERYQAMLEGTGSERLMVAEKKGDQKQSELRGWTDASEYGGGGANGDKALTEMTQNDFTQAFKSALSLYTTVAGRLNVRTNADVNPND